MVEFLSNYWLAIITVCLVIFVISYVLVSVYKTENKRKKWIKTIKLGDTCNVSTVGDSHLENVEIVELDDEYAVLEVRVKKRWLYPPEK